MMTLEIGPDLNQCNEGDSLTPKLHYSKKEKFIKKM